MASTPNVTILMVANKPAVKGGGEDFGFILTHSRIAAKKKEREKECAKEIVAALDSLPLEDMKAWCQIPKDGDTKKEVAPTDMEQLTTLVRRRCPKASIKMSEPAACVLVASMPWGPHERAHGPDPDLTVLEKFDNGFGELLREARRVSGLVRKQFFLAVVWAESDKKEDVRPFSLGIGLATDPQLAKVRALHAAEVRAHIITDAMFTKSVAPKNLPPAATTPAPATTPAATTSTA